MAKVIGYCHIGSQRGRGPTQVWTGRHGSEKGVGGTGPNPMKCDLARGKVHQQFLANEFNLELSHVVSNYKS